MNHSPADRSRRWLAVWCALLSVLCYVIGPALASGDRVPMQVAASVDGATSDGPVTIYVTSNGWHSAIVVPRAEIPPSMIPEAADFPEAVLLSFGWGDAEYFPTPDAGIGTMLSAALTPTPAVVHLSALDMHPQRFFPSAEVAEIALSREGFESLLVYLHESFDRAGAQRAHSSAPGLYRFSLFYPATGEFHLFNTCNTWTARSLEVAGVPIGSSGILRAEDLMAELEQISQQ